MNTCEIRVLGLIILIGVITSQILVFLFTQNRLRLQDQSRTIYETQTLLQQQIDPFLLQNSLEKYQLFIIKLFIFFNLFWILFISIFITPITTFNESIIIYIGYIVLLVLVSFGINIFYTMRNTNDTYIYLNFLYPTHNGLSELFSEK